jgi:hypothetical protein
LGILTVSSEPSLDGAVDPQHLVVLLEIDLAVADAGL